MAFWNRKRVEKRALTTGLANPAGWAADAFSVQASPSGKRVTVESALGLAPVYAAVSIISEQIGQLPLKVYKQMDDGDRVEARSHRAWSMLHDKPNHSTTADRFWSTAAAQILLHGNAFIRKARALGVVEELYLLDPCQTTVAYNPETGDKQFVYTPRDAIAPKRIYSSDEVLHLYSTSLDGIVGMSVVATCKAALGAAIARDEFEGGFYARGANLSGVLQTPTKLSDQAAQNLKESFKALYGGSGRAHGTPVLEEGLEFHVVGSPLRDLEFVQAQNMSRTDIAVMFKLPPNYLGGSSGDSLTYATVESNQIQFALHAIAPLTNAIAKGISNDSGILPQGVHEAEFTLEAMMRGAANDRADFYTKMVAMKAMHPDEVRSRENMPALTPAQKRDLAPPPPPQVEPPADQAQLPPGSDKAQPSADGTQPRRLPVRAVQ